MVAILKNISKENMHFSFFFHASTLINRDGIAFIFSTSLLLHVSKGWKKLIVLLNLALFKKINFKISNHYLKKIQIKFGPSKSAYIP